MSAKYPAVVYRRFSRRLVRQGDIAIGEFHQLRARSGDRTAPGDPVLASEQTPFFGEFQDFAVDIDIGGHEETRVLRVWRGPVMVLHQNCEIDFADSEDSRLLVAPIVSKNQWPEAAWSALAENLIPGFFYLPPIPAALANDLGLSGPWPEAVVALASSSLSSMGLIKPRREVSLSAEMLPPLHDSLVRFHSVRGFNDLEALENLKGKRIVALSETGQVIQGPSRLIKVYFGDNPAEVDDADDEAAVAFWGTR